MGLEHGPRLLGVAVGVILNARRHGHRRRREGQGVHHPGEIEIVEDRGVEAVGDLERGGPQARGLGGLGDGLHRLGVAGDHHLPGVVVVGDDRSRPEQGLGVLGAGVDGHHGAGIALVARHGLAPGAHPPHAGAEGQHPGGDGGGELTDGVPGHDGGGHARGGEQGGEGLAHGEQGRLGVLGVGERALGRLVLHLGVEQRGDGLAGPSGVGGGEGLSDDGEAGLEGPEHAHLLGALAGVEEGDLGIGVLLGGPDHRAVDVLTGGDGPQALDEAVAGVGDDGEAGGLLAADLPRPGHAGHGDGGVGGHGVGGAAGEGPEAGLVRGRHLDQLKLRRAGDLRCDLRRDRWGRGGGLRGPEHGVHVGAAEAEAAHRGEAARAGPGRRGRGDVEGGLREAEIRLGGLEVGHRRHYAAVQGEAGPDQARDAGGGHGVAHVGLGRAQGGLAHAGAEDLHQGRQLGLVPDAGPGAVGLHVAQGLHPLHGAVHGEAGVGPGHLDHVHLTGLHRGHGPLAAAVIVHGDPVEHCIDAIPCGHGVIEALEHHHAAAVALHEAVGPGVEGQAAPRGADGPDPREGDVVLRGEAEVDAPGEGHVHLPRSQPGHALGHREQRGRAGGVHGEGGALEAQLLGHGGGDHVGQHAGGREGPRGQHPIHRRRQGRGIGHALAEIALGHHLGQDPAGHEGAELHRRHPDVHPGALGQIRFGHAGVGDGLEGHLQDQPLLGIHHLQAPRGDLQAHRREGLDVLDEAASGGVGLVGLSGALIEEAVMTPAIGGDRAEAVGASHHLLSVGVQIPGAGETTAGADDGDGGTGAVGVHIDPGANVEAPHQGRSALSLSLVRADQRVALTRAITSPSVRSSGSFSSGR